MKKLVKWIVAAGLLAAVGMQFFNPPLENPKVAPDEDFIAVSAPPAEIALLLRHACYDCHSDQTTWPWYSRVAPVSWFVAGHVNDAREAMNFSEWPKDDAESARKGLNRLVRQVQTGKMPLPSYTWMHPASRLTGAQREQLTDWAVKTAAGLKD
jgi:hypothetical protein